MSGKKSKTGAVPQEQRKGGSVQNNSKDHRKKQMIYEPYWPLEQVNHGIKRGQLIVGAIKINPKNYEDAYIPLPDGTADIYIGGMPARNRALNSDVVVVQPLPYSEWRVCVEEFENFEKNTSVRIPSSNVKDGGTRGTGSQQDIDSDDSGPDVIYDEDSEEEGDSSVTGASGGVESGDVSGGVVSGIKDLQINSDGCSLQHEAMADWNYTSPVNQKITQDNCAHKTPTAMNTSTSSPVTTKFMSVSDMAQFGSPLAKQLFGSKIKGGVEDCGKMGKFLQQTGRVVYIYQKKHTRAASGRLKLMSDKNKNLALFSPTDSRIPRIIIPMDICPKDFYQRSADYANTLYIARIQEWGETSKMPKGVLARSLGEAGQIEPETEAMLIELDVNDSPFSEQVLQCLPQDSPWTIPEAEFGYRRDFRNLCVFTIDPATARDLDDALSIEEKEDGLYEIGVHIADVSYFVREGTDLNTEGASRATSVYLVQKVVPMLPRLLCEELCSLNPDKERLTFSVVWTINQEGEIFDEWYGRSVIRSCAKLSYDHAQGFIEEPDKKWSQEDLPPITNSFGVEDIVKRVLQLNEVAVNLRKQRFDNGALRLDQVKLQYTLDADSGLPNGYFVYQGKDSNRLVEEFMLLANMAVAHKIKSSFPDKAILRRHPPPQVKPLEAMEELCECLGLQIDTSTSGKLQHSLRQYYGEDELSQSRLQILVLLVSKPMQNAKYFCTGCIPDESLYHHYALSVPLYTHFTSPIRRYADIMVHRLLAASLGYSDPPTQSSAVLQRQAEICNDKKLNAKMASDRSSDMFFSIFVKEAGPLEENGMVLAVLDKSFDVLILKLGVTKRVYLQNLPVTSAKFQKRVKSPELVMVWPADESCPHETQHLITLFTKVKCYLYAVKGLQWTCIIRRPEEAL